MILYCKNIFFFCYFVQKVSSFSPSEVRKVLSAPSSKRGHYHRKKNSMFPPISPPETENYLDDLAVNEFGQHYFPYQQQSISNLPPTIQTSIQTNLSNNVIFSNNNQFEYQLSNRQHSFEENNNSNNLQTSPSNETYFENEIISPSTTFNLENLDEAANEEKFVKEQEEQDFLYINEFNLVNSMWFALGAVLQVNH